MAYDFKILSGAESTVQKTLNQWKNLYTLKINSFESIDLKTVRVFLIRIKKDS